MFDLPTPWVTSAARKLLADTEVVGPESVEVAPTAPQTPDEDPHG